MLHVYSAVYVYRGHDETVRVIGATVAEGHLEAEEAAVDWLADLKGIERCPPDMQLYKVEYQCTLDDFLLRGKVIELAHI